MQFLLHSIFHASSMEEAPAPRNSQAGQHEAQQMLGQAIKEKLLNRNGIILKAAANLGENFYDLDLWLELRVHLSILLDNSEMLKNMLAERSPVNQEDPLGFNPLLFALSLHSAPETLDLLVMHGARLNNVQKNLAYLAEGITPEEMLWLLMRGVTITISQSFYDDYFLDSLAMQNLPAAYDCLKEIEDGKLDSRTIEIALIIAAAQHYNHIFQILLERHKDDIAPKTKKQCLLISALTNSSAVLNCIYTQASDKELNSSDWQAVESKALRLAIVHGNVEAVYSLIDYGSFDYDDFITMQIIALQSFDLADESSQLRESYKRIEQKFVSKLKEINNSEYNPSIQSTQTRLILTCSYALLSIMMTQSK